MKKITDGNRLSIKRPDLCKEWDYEKNGNLSPEQVGFGSHKIIWWKCYNGHLWQSKINDRCYAKGCPYCYGHSYRVNKENCLKTLNPKLCEEWNYKKNIDISPEEVSVGSNKKVWWICKYGHEWVAQINNRNNGRGCPCCTNNKLCEEKSLAIVNPELAKQWHPTKNVGLVPMDVAANSHKKVWWICDKGHEYLYRISNRNRNKEGCPFCSGQRVCSENCLETLSPKLATEWHQIKNGNLNPKCVTNGSGKMAWWVCSKGHEWQSTIYNRTCGGNGCPICDKILLKDGTKFDSILEAYFYLKYLKNKYEKIEINKRYGGLGNKRYDFYVPEINTYFEITGYGDSSKGWGKKIWSKYKEIIAKKRSYVEKVLRAKFKFVQLKTNLKQTIIVRNNSV